MNNMVFKTGGDWESTTLFNNGVEMAATQLFVELRAGRFGFHTPERGGVASGGELIAIVRPQFDPKEGIGIFPGRLEMHFPGQCLVIENTHPMFAFEHTRIWYNGSEITGTVMEIYVDINSLDNVVKAYVSCYQPQWLACDENSRRYAAGGNWQYGNNHDWNQGWSPSGYSQPTGWSGAYPAQGNPTNWSPATFWNSGTRPFPNGGETTYPGPWHSTSRGDSWSGNNGSTPWNSNEARREFGTAGNPGNNGAWFSKETPGTVGFGTAPKTGSAPGFGFTKENGTTGGSTRSAGGSFTREPQKS